MKSDGGAIGITEKPSALLRWMTSGPEVCQLVNELDEHLPCVKQHQNNKTSDVIVSSMVDLG